jgi:hypothetical protein
LKKRKRRTNKGRPIPVSAGAWLSGDELSDDKRNEIQDPWMRYLAGPGHKEDRLKEFNGELNDSYIAYQVGPA